ncbi:DUF1467 family protein [Azospirillum sp. B21]|uniref:DUF1467 family protein n=1 Tax=unclassified Azospirillum TaxID=2630922 RepID=UPI0011EDCE53|nr:MULTISPECIES: DUF1467 family protein [unclassified Azospirillum]KAA0583575.1 DUF1467 family protein [Azospirillum sp. B21]MDR6770123.1 putative secreted protein [Azospirillum sp. BE72]
MDNWVTAVFVYIVVWWVVLFGVLPWGVRTPDEPEPGMASSAPVEPRILRKFMITSVVALLVWLVIFGVERSGIISFREMARHMY